MIALNLRWNIDQVMRDVQGLRADVTDQAAAAALNKTADKARTAMTREITSEFMLQASVVRNVLEVSRASKRLDKLVAVLRAFGSSSKRGRSLNLIRFLEKSVTLAEVRRRRKTGTLNALRFRIRKGQGPKMIPGAFVGNKGRTIFQRVGKSRLPIKAVQTIDVPQMFNTRRINARVIELIEREFPIEFERAAKLFTDRFNARG